MLRFPDAGLGRILVRARDADETSGWDSNIRRAAGPVELPAEVRVKLLAEHVRGDADLVCFREFPADAIDEFELLTRPFGRKISITDNGLADLAQLRGLERLILRDTLITGRGLTHLSRMPGLRSLEIGANEIGDAGLQALEGLHELRDLELFRTGITSEGLRWLAGLRRLERLGLDSNRIGDDGLEYLVGLEHLEAITLRASEIHGSGFAHLTRLPRLAWITVSESPVSDAHLSHLLALGARPIHMLNLARTRITDAAIPILAQLDGLERLDISHTGISGTNILDVARLPQLKLLTRVGTDIPDDAIDALLELRPGLRIW